MGVGVAASCPVMRAGDGVAPLAFVDAAGCVSIVGAAGAAGVPELQARAISPTNPPAASNNERFKLKAITHLLASALSANIQTNNQLKSRPHLNPLPSRERKLTPSPLTGEGWDEGNRLAHNHD